MSSLNVKKNYIFPFNITCSRLSVSENTDELSTMPMTCSIFLDLQVSGAGNVDIRFR